MSAGGPIDLAEAWHLRETMLRAGIPPELRAAAVTRAMALRDAAMRSAFRRLASTLSSVPNRLIWSLGRRARTGARHLRAG